MRDFLARMRHDRVPDAMCDEKEALDQAKATKTVVIGAVAVVVIGAIVLGGIRIARRR